jgi:hypothetical protein
LPQDNQCRAQITRLQKLKEFVFPQMEQHFAPIRIFCQQKNILIW